MEKITPGNFAILTACVRYDSELTANAKLLYAEISALSNKVGYCFASNNYFAKLYSVTPQAVSKWIKLLETKEYIKCTYILDGKEIKERHIYLNTAKLAPEDSDSYSAEPLEVSTKDLEGINKGFRGYQQMVKDNNKFNNKFNNSSDEEKTKSPKKRINKTDEELEILFSEFEIKEVNIAKTCINNFYIKKRSNDSKYARTPNQLRNWTYQLLKFSKDSERGIEEVAKVWNYIINDSYSMPYLADVKKFVTNFENYIQKCNTSLSRSSYSQKQSLVGSGFDKAHENTVFDHKDEGGW